MLIVATVGAAEPTRSERPARVEVISTEHTETCAHGCPERPADDPPTPPGPPLTRDEITPEIRKMEAEVRTCGRAVDASGSITVRIDIRESGRVYAAIVTERLANTPLATCVEHALKTFRFRRNRGFSLTYPFVFATSAGAPACGDAGGPGKKVNATALQRLGAPLGRCSSAAITGIPVRLAMDAKGVIRSAATQRPYGGTREGFCVDRTLACLVGAIADGLPTKWEVGLSGQVGAPATLRPLNP